MMAAREVSGVHGSADSSSAVSSIWRQGSMNLPPPEQSGVPPDHPDMCILRIRRNHLIEVRRRTTGFPEAMPLRGAHMQSYKKLAPASPCCKFLYAKSATLTLAPVV